MVERRPAGTAGGAGSMRVLEKLAALGKTFHRHPMRCRCSQGLVDSALVEYPAGRGGAMRIEPVCRACARAHRWPKTDFSTFASRTRLAAAQQQATSGAHATVAASRARLRRAELSLR